MFGLFAKKGDGPDYASFERRMLASIIDTVLLAFLLAPLLAAIWNPAAEMQAVVRQIMADYQSQSLSPDQFTAAMRDYIVYGGGGILYMKDIGFQLIVFGVIVILFWIYRRGTPGKILLRLEVVDAKTHGPLSVWQSVVRYLGYFVAAAPLLLGFVWILFSRKGQGWHDMLAGTVVLVKPRKSKEVDKDKPA